MFVFLKNKNILTIGISCLIVWVLFASSWFLRVLNKTLQNQYYSLKNDVAGISANPHIIIVELDNKTFDMIGSFPFPRSVYAQALENIEKFHPAVVAFDILFLDPSLPQEDAIFQKILWLQDNIVLWSATDIGEKEVQIPYFKNIKNGFLFPEVEKSNKTVYSFSPLFEDKNNIIYEHFTLQILRSFYTLLYGDETFQKPGMLTSTQYIFSPTLSYPLSSKNSEEILINFIDPKKFTRISFWDLLTEESTTLLDAKIDFQDKIFLIGPAAEGLKDDFFTPNGTEYGVNIHANILNTLLSKQYMMYFNKNLEWILIFFLIILSVSVNLSSSRKVLIWSNIAIILIFWFLFPLSILLGTNLILNYPSEIIFSLILALWSANIVKYLIEDKNKQRLNKALTEYVGSSIAEEILSEQGKLNFDGEEKLLLYFFSDIEGFTTFSEILSPKELVGFLREYLTIMTSCIMEQQGYVDKFEGDAIMALWGAFTPLDAHSYTSLCESALKQQEALIFLNQKWGEKFGKKISVRMGLHGWEAIVWNIGALGKKMDFTALGDHVNLASRLEGANKFYGTYICVSEVIYNETKNIFFYRFLDEIQVKWKDNSVKIYELIAKNTEVSQEKKEQYTQFEQAQSLYTQRKFKQAKTLFEELRLLWDIPSETYITRCDMFLENPPESDWKGVWRMMEK